MDVVVPNPPQSREHPLLSRRNSVPTSVVVPAKFPLLHHCSSSSTTTAAAAASSSASSSSSFPSDDLEFLSIKPSSHSYTSIRDLLPSVVVNSPKPNASHSQPGSDICIRNRLVKQAAWAYLQPMSTSPGSDGNNFLRRLWPRAAAFIDLIRRSVSRALKWTLRFIGIRSSI